MYFYFFFRDLGDYTPVFEAVRFDMDYHVGELIKRGADLTIRNDLELCPLDIATPRMKKIIQNYQEFNRIPPNPPKKIQNEFIMKPRPVPLHIYFP